MTTKFCQQCGTKIVAEAKFCAACGQAQVSLEGSESATTPFSFAAEAAAEAAKASNKKGLILGGSAAIILAALAIVFFVINPMTARLDQAESPSGSTSIEDQPLFGSSSLDGKPASAVLRELMNDGFCPVPDTRSEFTDYPTLLGLYDADTLRGCTEATNGNYFFIYANQTPSDLQYELDTSSETQNVYGRDWILEFVGSDNASVIAEIAQKYGATID
jgi:hypothetical protein